MRLDSQSSQFVFNMNSSILTPEVLQTYTPFLEKNWIQYDNVIDYINSTIKSVSFPGISFDMPKQNLMRGKTRNFKPAINIQDITTTRQLTITFRSVDSDFNYWLLFDMISKNYLNTDSNFIDSPFTITCLDIHRDAIYVIRFYELIFNSLGDNTFNYSSQKIQPKDFTLTVNFNFYDVEFLGNKSKVLELSNIPTIIQKI